MNLMILDYQPPAAINLMLKVLAHFGHKPRVWWLTSWAGASEHESEDFTWIDSRDVPSGPRWAQPAVHASAQALLDMGETHVALLYGSWFPLTKEAADYGLSEPAVVAGLKYKASRVSCSTCLAAHRPDIKAAFDFWSDELASGETKSHFSVTSYPMFVDLYMMKRLIESVEHEHRAANVMDLYGNLCIDQASVLTAVRPPVIRDHNQELDRLTKVNEKQEDRRLMYLGATRRGWNNRRHIDYVDRITKDIKL